MEPIAFGLAILWEMTLASFSTPPPRLGTITGLRGLYRKQPVFMQVGVQQLQSTQCMLIFIGLSSKC